MIICFAWSEDVFVGVKSREAGDVWLVQTALPLLGGS